MPSEPQAMIRELEDRRFRAMCERDTQTLEALLADGLVYTHSSASVDSSAGLLRSLTSNSDSCMSPVRPDSSPA